VSIKVREWLKALRLYSQTTHEDRLDIDRETCKSVRLPLRSDAGGCRCGADVECLPRYNADVQSNAKTR
jgi:hypothetical protein